MIIKDFICEMIHKLIQHFACKVEYLTDVPAMVPDRCILRRQQEQELYRLLKQRGSIILLSGPGGSGKTHMARRLFYRLNTQYSRMAWIEYGSDMRTSIANSLKCTHNDENQNLRFAESVLQLAKFPKDTILFIDDVKESAFSDDVFSRITGLGITILATSRCEGIPPYQTIHLDPISTDECVKLFYAHYPYDRKKKHINTVRKLLPLLNGNIMATIMLARVIGSEHSLESNMRKLSRDHIRNSWSADNLTEYTGKLLRLSKISFAENSLLQSLALLPSGETPHFVISWLDLHLDVIQRLVTNGWIEWNSTTKTYFLHDLIRDYFEIKGFSQSLVQTLIERIICTDSLDNPTADKYYQYKLDCLDRMLRYAKDCCPILTYGYLQLADGYTTMNRYSIAIDYTKSALENAIIYHHEDNNLLTDIHYRLGLLYQCKGLFGDALKQHLEARAVHLHSSNPDCGITIILEINIGEMYCKLGEFTAALEYLKNALRYCDNLPEDSSIDLAELHNDIGIVYDKMGDYHRALEYYQKALHLWEEQQSDVSIAVAYNNLSCVLGSLGDMAGALDYSKKALDLTKSEYGDMHPETANSYMNLGCSYADLKMYYEAIEHLQVAMNIHRKILGDNHPDTANAYNNIGEVWFLMGDYQKAKDYHLKSLEIRKSIPSLSPLDTAESLDNLCAVYCSLYEYSKALNFGLQALAIQEKHLPANHPDIAKTRMHLCHVYAKMGKVEEALSNGRSSLESYFHSLGIYHPLIRDHFLELREIYQQLSRDQPFDVWCRNNLSVPNAKSFLENC